MIKVYNFVMATVNKHNLKPRQKMIQLVWPGVVTQTVEYNALLD